MRINKIASIALLTLPLSGVCATEPPKLESEAARISYSLGYQIGGDFKRQNVEVEGEAVLQGIADALSGSEPVLSSQEMYTLLMDLKRKIVAEQRARQKETEIKNIAQDKQFLEDNAAKPGFVTSKSGLQYKIIAEGTGKTPDATAQVTVNYRGTLVNGQEFDSSYARGEPSSFQLDKVIKGWTEGLQHVKEGGKIQLVIPPELAYDRGPLEKRTLLFEVELISVGDKKQPENKKVADIPAG